MPKWYLTTFLCENKATRWILTKSPRCDGINLKLKVHGHYFSKFSFLLHLKDHHSKDVNFKFHLKQSSRLHIRSNFVYCRTLPKSYICVSLIMVTITRHVFINTYVTQVFFIPVGAQGGSMEHPLRKPFSNRNFAMKFAPYGLSRTIIPEKNSLKCYTNSKWRPNNRFLFCVVSILAKI